MVQLDARASAAVFLEQRLKPRVPSAAQVGSWRLLRLPRAPRWGGGKGTGDLGNPQAAYVRSRGNGDADWWQHGCVCWEPSRSFGRTPCSRSSRSRSPTVGADMVVSSEYERRSMYGFVELLGGRDIGVLLDARGRLLTSSWLSEGLAAARSRGLGDPVRLPPVGWQPLPL